MELICSIMFLQQYSQVFPWAKEREENSVTEDIIYVHSGLVPSGISLDVHKNLWHQYGWSHFIEKFNNLLLSPSQESGNQTVTQAATINPQKALSS